jgi:uncharacterized protein (UPF0276 family)
VGPLALSYEGHDIPSDVIELVDVLELTPETIAHAGGGRPTLNREHVARLRDINERTPLTIHGVSLSIGSADRWNDAYLQLLDQCFEAFPNVLWHSEHLGFTRIDGVELCTMLPIPFTQETLDLVSARVNTLMSRYGRPFLLEPVVNLLPPPPGDISEATYLNALAASTTCGILLDAYNLVCDARNHGRDIAALVNDIDTRHVREVHIAGGVAVDGVQLDVHTSAPEEQTLAVAEAILMRRHSDDVLVTFELLREGYEIIGDRLSDEVHRVRRWLEAVSSDAGSASAVA